MAANQSSSIDMADNEFAIPFVMSTISLAPALVHQTADLTVNKTVLTTRWLEEITKSDIVDPIAKRDAARAIFLRYGHLSSDEFANIQGDEARTKHGTDERAKFMKQFTNEYIGTRKFLDAWVQETHNEDSFVVHTANMMLESIALGFVVDGEPGAQQEERERKRAQCEAIAEKQMEMLRKEIDKLLLSAEDTVRALDIKGSTGMTMVRARRLGEHGAEQSAVTGKA